MTSIDDVGSDVGVAIVESFGSEPALLWYDMFSCMFNVISVSGCVVVSPIITSNPLFCGTPSHVPPTESILSAKHPLPWK